MTILVDTREPHGDGTLLHPWAAHWPAEVRVVRGTLPTGDLSLAALPDGAVVERKTVPDFLAAVGVSAAGDFFAAAGVRVADRRRVVVDDQLRHVAEPPAPGGEPPRGDALPQRADLLVRGHLPADAGRAGVRVPDHGAERGGGAGSPEGDAGDPAP